MAGLAAVEAGIIPGRLALAGGAAISTSLLPGSFLLFLLLATTWSSTTVLGRARRDGAFLLLLLEGVPLLHCVQQLASGSSPFGVRPSFVILHCLEPLGHVLDGELLEIEECLYRHHDLEVLPRHAAEEFLHRALLCEVGVTVARRLLHQIGQAKGKVLNLLTGMKGEAFPLLPESL